MMDEPSGRFSEPLLSPLSSDRPEEDESGDAIGESNQLHVDEDEVLRNKILLFGLYGRSYALRWNFWWQRIIICACLGALVGCVVGVFLWTHRLVALILFPDRRHDEFERSVEDSPYRYDRRQWWWILVTAGGSLLASLVLELPRAPKPETFRTIIHDIVSLDGNFVESSHAVISSWIALAFGLPVGVDLAVATIGTGCAKLVADAVNADPKTRGLYVQSGLSAALSLLLPSPILGLLLVQELGMITRSRILLVPTAVLEHSRRTQEEENVIAEADDCADHDFMEQVTVASITMASCVGVVHTMFPSSVVDAMTIQSYTIPTLARSDSVGSLFLDCLRAISIGLLGGAVVSLSAGMYLKWSWTRIKGCAFFTSNERLKFSRARQVFALFAGSICGVLGYFWSYPLLFDNGVNAWQNVMDAKSSGLSAYEVLQFGVHAMLGVCVCVGCGVLGGCFFPMLTVGACLGVGISCKVFPLSLAVPCSMAACISGIFPAPITVVLFISMMFNLDTNLSTSVLIASVSSYTLTGGSSILRRLGACAWKLSLESGVSNLEETDAEDMALSDVEILHDRRRADYEIRQEVRSKIFGKPCNEKG